MEKIRINSIEEYRKHAFDRCDKHGSCDNVTINRAFGLKFIHDCYDVDADGNDIDESGNIIPPDTAENVKVEDWVNDLKFPIILLEWIERGFDRSGDYTIVCVETVSLEDFN